jgi:hypothetical protein
MVTSNGVIQIKMSKHALPACLAEATAEPGIRQYLQDRICNGVVVTARNEETFDIMGKVLSIPPHVTHHDGALAGHRFQQG